jgi:hypothetical protein
MTEKFIETVQQFVSNGLGAAAARNMGPAGLVTVTRRFTAALDLVSVVARGPRQFPQKLDDLTDDLRSSFPRGGQAWGPARKFLNLFLRDALYNFYLREAFQLDGIEEALELPLDSHVARGLRGEAEGARLPGWKSVKSLTPNESAKFQEVAAAVASRQGIARVHLDLGYWRRPPRPKRTDT